MKGFSCWLLRCFLNLALLLLNHTWTLASVNLVLRAKIMFFNLIAHSTYATADFQTIVNYLCASSSLVYTSGYWVRWKALSNSSNCSPVNVVLLLLCLRFNGIPGSDSVSVSSPLLPPINIILNNLFKKQKHCSSRLSSTRRLFLFQFRLPLETTKMNFPNPPHKAFSQETISNFLYIVWKFQPISIILICAAEDVVHKIAQFRLIPRKLFLSFLTDGTPAGQLEWVEIL